MSIIPLTKGLRAVVDDIDFERFGHFPWYAQNGYAARRDGKRGIVFLHNEIFGLPACRLVDHIDRNKMNNRRVNLRLVSIATNNQNTPRRNNTAGYHGVHWDKERRRWVAQIGSNYTVKGLGRFATAEEAAIAYNHAALELHGPRALLNTVRELTLTVRRQESPQADGASSGLPILPSPQKS